MNTFCPQCHFQNPPGLRFCGNCGARLADTHSDEGDSALNDFAPDQFGSLMGPDLLQRFRKAGVEATGQRRNVTIMFVDLCGYTPLSERMDDEDLFELVQEYIQVLANDVYKYEGVVDKFTGDGLMALFGAPIAHENNAELAIRSAIEMHQDVFILSTKAKNPLLKDLHVRIGLHSGPVIVGGIGSDKLMNYTAIGDTVNLAQRLENAAAPGATLVSEPVYRQTQAIFHFDSSPAFQLKGINRLVRGYQVLGIKTKPGRVRGIEGLYAPMIGREIELSKLRTVVDKLVVQNQGSFVLLTGEAGIGKSRLISELKLYLQHTGVQLMEGRSLTYRRLVSFWIIMDAIRSFLGVVPDTSSTQLRGLLHQRVQSVLIDHIEETLPFLEHILSLPPDGSHDSDRLRYLEAGKLRQQTFMAVRNWLSAEAQAQALVVILEDLHWADEASLDLLSFLLEATPRVPLLVIGVSRPVREGALFKIANWAAQNLGDNYCHLLLQALSPSQCQTLLYQLLESSELPTSFQQAILQKTAGLPFYLEEILRSLIDQGLMKREAGIWKLPGTTEVNGLSIPDSIEGLILARFDRLNEMQRRILQVASVIGQEFSLPVLSTVLKNLDHDSLRDSLNLLAEREFIQPHPDSPYTEYTFRHTLMSDAIYKTLLKKERSELHGQIGEAIETIYQHRLEGQVEILARHYSWSPRKDKALHYLFLAGQKAARDYTNDQARQQFELALQILPHSQHTPYQAYQVYAGLGDVLAFGGEYAQARQHYLSAYTLLQPEDASLYGEERSSLQRKIGITYEHQGDFDQALACMVVAQSELSQSPLPDPVEKAEILNETGWIYYRRRNIDDALKSLSVALSLVENTSRYDVIASIYNRLGGVFYLKEDLEQASHFVRKSLALREEMGDVAAVARSYNNLGLLSWKLGNWENALENFHRSFGLHANLGDIEGIIDLHGNLGLLYLDRGEIASAQHHFQESLSRAQQIGHHYIIGVTYNYQSKLYLLTGDWSSCLEAGQKSLQVLKEIGSPEDLADIYANIGEAYLRLERLTEAAQSAKTALEWVEKLGGAPSATRGRVLRLYGRLQAHEGNLSAAAKAYKQSLGTFEVLKDPLEQGRTLVALAQLAQARNDPINARVLRKQARLIFTQLKALLDLKNLAESPMVLEH